MMPDSMPGGLKTPVWQVNATTVKKMFHRIYPWGIAPPYRDENELLGSSLIFSQHSLLRTIFKGVVSLRSRVI